MGFGKATETLLQNTHLYNTHRVADLGVWDRLAASLARAKSARSFAALCFRPSLPLCFRGKSLAVCFRRAESQKRTEGIKFRRKARAQDCGHARRATLHCNNHGIACAADTQVQPMRRTRAMQRCSREGAHKQRDGEVPATDTGSSRSHLFGRDARTMSIKSCVPIEWKRVRSLRYI